MSDEGQTHWAVSAEASSTFASGPAPPRFALSETVGPDAMPEPTQASVGDGSDEGMAYTVSLWRGSQTYVGRNSISGSGHAVQFDRPDQGRFIEAVEIYASRYGQVQPPDEDFHLYVLNEAFQVLADLPYPYAMIERADMRWYTLRTPSIEVPERFYVAVAFNPHRTKGIYLGYSESLNKPFSYMGLPDSGYRQNERSHEWMLRVHLSDSPSGDKEVKRLADWKAPKHTDPFEGCIEAKYDDGKSSGKQSYSGAGPLIRFEVDEHTVLPKRMALEGLRVYGSRYGSGYDPGTSMVDVRVSDATGKEIGKTQFPYALFSYKEKWVDIVFAKPIPIDTSVTPIQLSVALDPHAQRTKGIYFHYASAAKVSHSGTARNGKLLKETPGREWMIRAYLGSE